MVERDRSGFLLTGGDLQSRALRGFDRRTPMLVETSVPGVFAAGDVRFGSTKRLASAVGEGAVVIRVVHDYLQQLAAGAARDERSEPRGQERPAGAGHAPSGASAIHSLE